MSFIFLLHNTVASALGTDTRQLLRSAASAVYSYREQTNKRVAAVCADTEPAVQEVAEHSRCRIARMVFSACAR